MKQTFEQLKFRPDSLTLIEKADEILKSYNAQGYTMTLRQVYYQLVAKDIIPNTTKSYDNLGALITKARRAGLIDWSHMEDRTRNITTYAGYQTTEELIRPLQWRYQQDRWFGQDYFVECWVEKEALAGVIEQGASRYHMGWMACRGYMADIEFYSAAGRIQQRYRNKRQKTIVLHFGDHDPSGIDMTRDNADRFQYFGCDATMVEVQRVALNMDQVEEYNPPPNPAKQTDSRFLDYADKFGHESWELDALTPQTITALIDDAYERYVDREKWDEALLLEQAGRNQMEALNEKWSEVEALIGTHRMFLPGRRRPNVYLDIDDPGSEEAGSGDEEEADDEE